MTWYCDVVSSVIRKPFSNLCIRLPWFFSRSSTKCVHTSWLRNIFSLPSSHLIPIRKIVYHDLFSSRYTIVIYLKCVWSVEYVFNRVLPSNWVYILYFGIWKPPFVLFYTKCNSNRFFKSCGFCIRYLPFWLPNSSLFCSVSDRLL